MTLVSWLILAGIAIVVLALLSLLLSKQYRKVGPNEALIISGRKRTMTLPDGTKRKVGYRYRLGGGTFVMPFLETVDILPMDVIPLNPALIKGTHGRLPATSQTGPLLIGTRKDLAAERFAMADIKQLIIRHY